MVPKVGLRGGGAPKNGGVAGGRSRGGRGSCRGYHQTRRTPSLEHRQAGRRKKRVDPASQPITTALLSAAQPISVALLGDTRPISRGGHRRPVVFALTQRVMVISCAPRPISRIDYGLEAGTWALCTAYKWEVAGHMRRTQWSGWDCTDQRTDGPHGEVERSRQRPCYVKLTQTHSHNGEHDHGNRRVDNACECVCGVAGGVVSSSTVTNRHFIGHPTHSLRPPHSHSRLIAAFHVRYFRP